MREKEYTAGEGGKRYKRTARADRFSRDVKCFGVGLTPSTPRLSPPPPPPADIFFEGTFPTIPSHTPPPHDAATTLLFPNQLAHARSSLPASWHRRTPPCVSKPTRPAPAWPDEPR